MTLHTNIKANDSTSIVTAGEQLLYAIKTQQDPAIFIHRIANAKEEEITSTLTTDELKKAFWLNIYNAYVQYLLKEDTTAYKSRNTFFKKRQVAVAGRLVSLDFIEHGILRRSKNKLSMGYFNKLFPSQLEKAWRVDAVDWRIHFALNCGASSCPPIAFYDPTKIDHQLNLATRSYLSGEVAYDSVANTVLVPKLMSWFRGDFGGKKGIISILKQYELIPQNTNPKIRYKDYDWTLMLEQYKA